MEEKLKSAIELLDNSKSKKRESGAKRLRKIGDIKAGPFLLSALEKEVTDPRTWSTQYHIILALGFSEFNEALPFLLDLARTNFKSTILYSALGDSIFRLSVINKSIHESLSIIYSFNDFRIIDGAFRAIAMLRLIPDDDDIREIIKKASDPKGAKFVKGYPNDETGLRKWVASASSGWKDKLKNEFLNECANIDDQHLKIAVENSRSQKYVKWSPY